MRRIVSRILGISSIASSRTEEHEMSTYHTFHYEIWELYLHTSFLNNSDIFHRRYVFSIHFASVRRSSPHYGGLSLTEDTFSAYILCLHIGLPYTYWFIEDTFPDTLWLYYGLYVFPHLCKLSIFEIHIPVHFAPVHNSLSHWFRPSPIEDTFLPIHFSLKHTLAQCAANHKLLKSGAVVSTAWLWVMILVKWLTCMTCKTKL